MAGFDLSMLIDGQYAEWLRAGLLVSLKLLGLCLAMALPLGFLIATLRTVPFAPLRWIGAAYVEVFRNIPVLVHLLFWYFAAPELLPDGMKRWLYARDVEFLSAVIALTLYTAAFMGEDIRSGIRSIATHQFEAARALGLSFNRTMRWIILPQSFRIVVPPLIGQTLSLWKNTSIAMAIGVAEMMFQAAQVESSTFHSYEPYAVATLAYLVVSLAISGAAVIYQRRFPAMAG